MVKLISVIAFLFGLFSINSDEPTEEHTLSVEIDNFRNKDGVLYIFLYNYENQWPDNPFRYYAIPKSNVKNEHLLVHIPELSSGKYAVSVLDDENNNEDMDFFLGIPTEGYAFSNNIKPHFSLPDYNELLFPLDVPNKRLRIKMRYVF